MSKITINIHNFRAIEQASIELEDITVVTGVNASGKSTISRLLFYAGYYSNHYEELLVSRLTQRLLPFSFFLHQNLYLLSDESKGQLSNIPRYSITIFIEEDAKIIINGIREFYNNGAQVKGIDRERLGKALGKKISDRSAFLSGLDDLENQIVEIYSEFYKQLKERPIGFFTPRLNQLFRTEELDLLQKISVAEGGVEVVGARRKSMGLFTSLNRFFYIDTPMVANMQGNQDILHWNQLLDIFSDKTPPSPLENEALELSRNLGKIMGGDLVFPNNNIGVNRNQPIYFQDSDGNQFSLPEVASGIKSFAILQILLMRGLLNDRTLLIIDEPEAHLHPQWVVEYAKLIVELNRKLGVRFLLASHSTDMIQALSVKSTTKGLADTLKFYLAEQEEHHRYKFTDTEGNIEPIFKVFNKSIDSIDQLLDQE